MRQLERIDRITNLINAIWKHEQHQDLRFHQLIGILENELNTYYKGVYGRNLYKKEEYLDSVTTYLKQQHVDLFNVEDDKTENFLIAYFESLK